MQSDRNLEYRLVPLVFGIAQKWKALLLLLAIVLIGSFLRIYLLGAQSVWYDEMFSIVVAKTSLPSIVSATAQDVHPPLYYFLLHYWILAFGESDVAVRFLSAIFGILAIPMVYLVGRRLFNEEVALIGAFITAISPLNVYYSQEARMYSLLVLLTLLSMYFFMLLMRGTSQEALYIGYVLSTALLLYTHAYGLFVFFAQNIYFLTLLVLKNWPRAGIKQWVGLQCCVALLFAPWIYTLLRQASIWAVQHSGATPPVVSALLYTLQVYSGSALLLVLFLVLCGLLVLEAGGRYRKIKQKSFEPAEDANLSARVPISQASYLCLVWLLTLNLAPFFISQVFPSIYDYRYAIAASIPIYLFVAKGVSVIRIKPLQLAVIGIVAVLSFSAIYHLPVPEIQGTYVSIGVTKAPVREAVNYIDKNAHSADLVVFSPWWERYFFYHYTTRSLAVSGLPTYDTESNAVALNALSNATHGHDRIWLVEDNSPQYSELRLLAMENMSKSYHISYNASYGEGFGSCQVHLFER